MYLTDQQDDIYKKLLYICECASQCFEDLFPSIGNIAIFPNNYCEESSIILNEILNDLGINDFELFKGTSRSGYHHYWLQNHTYVIDLTAHQFIQIPEKINICFVGNYPLSSIFCEIDVVSPTLNIYNLTNEIKSKFYQYYYYPNESET